MNTRHCCSLLAIALLFSLIAGCASSYSGIIPVAGPKTGQDTPARRLAALNAAEEVLLSRGFDALRVEKDKGYMKYILQVDADTAHLVNVRLVDVKSGKNDVEMDVDVRIMRERYEEESGVSLGGGIGVGGSGGGFGFGIRTPSKKWNDDDAKFALKKEIAAAVDQALAGQ